VVRRLVEHQRIRFLQHQFTEMSRAALPPESG
jgi:hypothetical protein